MDKEIQTPTQQLAENITAALIKAGLVEKARRGELIENIVGGRMDSGNWSLLIDRATEVAEKESKNGR